MTGGGAHFVATLPNALYAEISSIRADLIAAIYFTPKSWIFGESRK